MEPQRLRVRPIDVLVIAAILLIGFSLMLPAVVTIGHVNHEVRCETNLRALGTALLSYAGYKVFPPGIISDVPPSNRRSDGWIFKDNRRELPEYVAKSEQCDNPGMVQASGLTQILAFLGETAAYDSYNFSLACCSIQNATAVSVRVSTFTCPANRLQFVPGASWGYYQAPPHFGPLGPGPTDYVFSIGGVGIITAYSHPTYSPDWYGTVPGWPLGDVPAGPFNVVNKGIRSPKADRSPFKDGAQFTFVMGEAIGGLPVAVNKLGHLPKGNEPISVPHESLIVQTPWSQGFLGGLPEKRDGRPSSRGGSGSVFAATAWNAWYERTSPREFPSLAPAERWFCIPPNEGGGRMARPTWYRESSPDRPLNHLAQDGSGIPGDIGCVQGFHSAHPTVPMLFADGSVRQIKPSIDPKIWVGLSTIRGREPIPDDF
jgi:hypothetical protein